MRLFRPAATSDAPVGAAAAALPPDWRAAAASEPDRLQLTSRTPHADHGGETADGGREGGWCQLVRRPPGPLLL